ncbi:uncharacterized protein UV8b_00610 [Ustilaginoidea virens]|uniref:Uncharacterized protein n=1 Tax=Ustilaginoidea virens TaxID=1159556 RepID=A0A063BW27_USTVR|nr:uncharacterized protein UV8b_00610 [Ustilaginoidea virens]QUC16369.1 hypothetical protein UV8b_00610 [Ustilaginoidea virens]GAO13406.1 hypothetical protein UVI_02014130 [Ustilaginoidea virens]
MGSSQSHAGTDAKDKSLYRKYQDAKGPKPIKDEDILKYTGKTRDQLHAWADETPGVGRNQLAGKLALGPASGLGGAAAAAGYGGWGTDAEPRGPSRGMKFPPGRDGGEEEQQESLRGVVKPKR